MSSLTSTYADLAVTDRVDRAARSTQPTAVTLVARLRNWLTGPTTNPIEQMIRANGGVMSDALERDISRHLGI